MVYRGEDAIGTGPPYDRPMTVGIGDPAPSFTLPGTGDRSYSLADEKGNIVVLVFYPGDNTPVCTTQLRTYSNNFDQFEGTGAVVWAISPQNVESHEKFSCKQGGFKFPLLADTDKAVGRAYGILGPVGFYRRSVFVVDGAGIIRYAHRALSGLTYRPTDELVKAVAAASA
jgi:thioredoxin-dependent peroxiredoxin